MHPQYLARQCVPSRLCEALVPHRRVNRSIAYRLEKNSSILKGDCTQAIHTSKIQRGLGVCPTLLSISDRRIQCRMLSKVLWLSVCSLPSRLASRHLRTITWLSSRSRSSPFRLVSTNPNFRILIPRQAARPASTYSFIPRQCPVSEGIL